MALPFVSRSAGRLSEIKQGLGCSFLCLARACLGRLGHLWRLWQQQHNSTTACCFSQTRPMAMWMWAAVEWARPRGAHVGGGFDAAMQLAPRARRVALHSSNAAYHVPGAQPMKADAKTPAVASSKIVLSSTGPEHGAVLGSRPILYCTLPQTAELSFIHDACLLNCLSPCTALWFFFLLLLLTLAVYLIHIFFLLLRCRVF